MPRSNAERIIESLETVSKGLDKQLGKIIMYVADWRAEYLSDLLVVREQAIDIIITMKGGCETLMRSGINSVEYDAEALSKVLRIVEGLVVMSKTDPARVANELPKWQTKIQECIAALKRDELPLAA